MSTELQFEKFNRWNKDTGYFDEYTGVLYLNPSMGPQLAKHFDLTYRGASDSQTHWLLDIGHSTVEHQVTEGHGIPSYWVLKRNHPAGRPIFVTPGRLLRHFEYSGPVKNPDVDKVTQARIVRAAAEWMAEFPESNSDLSIDNVQRKFNALAELLAMGHIELGFSGEGRA